MTSSTNEQILDVADAGMRRGGFDSVSYRDIAQEIGIKSASVHYHFPQKADLGVAVVRRYCDGFLAHLGSPDDPTETPRERIARLTGGYRATYGDQGTSCLCLTLGAGIRHLPEEVAAEVSGFYGAVLGWTEKALGNRPDGVETAARILGAMMGGMALSLAMADGKYLALQERSVLDSL